MTSHGGQRAGGTVDMVRAGRVVVATVVAVVMLGACSSSSKTAAPTSTSTSTTATGATTTTTAPNTTSTTATLQTFKVGDQIHLGKFGVEVHGLVDPYRPEGKDVAPKKGNRYVGVDTEVVDLDQGAVQVVSQFQLALEDSNGTRYTVRGMGHGQSTIDVALQHLKSIRRMVIYEIPTTAKGLSLVFAGAFGGAQVRIKLS